MSGVLPIFAKLIAQGTLVTVKMSILSAIVASVAAAAAGTARLANWPAARWISTVYIEVFRGTSVFVQLFWAYFVLPFLGIEISAIAAGVLAIGLNMGAYGAESVRAAILAVPREQIEASIALNMTKIQRFRHVILPQALLFVMPSVSNYGIEIVKSTAVVSLISITDLTYNAEVVRAQTGASGTPFFVVLLIYFAINSVIAKGARYAEARLGAGMDRAAGLSKV